MNSSFVFDPLLPIWVIFSLTVLIVLAATLGQWRGLKSFVLRTMAAFLLCGALLNPQKLIEQRKSLPDIAVVITDQSDSMAIENRTKVAGEVQAKLNQNLSALDNTEIVQISIPPGQTGTALAQTIIDGLGKLPEDRLSAVFAVTDGQVHDLPKDAAVLVPNGVPFHGIIVGDKSARDRRLEAVLTPKYGMIGEIARFEVQVADAGHNGERAQMEIWLNGVMQARFPAVIGDKISIPLEIEKRGVNTVEIRAAKAPNELTTLNNVLIAEISGVRDRLRVLLVTGEPHMGGRAWRNLLKSDPSVDLVQFTILTNPGVKNTRAQPRELSLIRFPERELFEEKLDEFDLIIFDQFKRRTMAAGGRTRPMLNPIYLSNVAKYVENGGALLVAAGTAFSGEESLARSALIAVLPAKPTGDIDTSTYRANLSDKGKRHPITSIFNGETSETWGRWYRVIDAEVIKGDVLMVNDDKKPLLVVDKVKKGRVGLLLSDQAWLWSRGHDGGGPYNEMFRRLSHWLMGEPDLEADQLRARVESGLLQIEHHALDDKTGTVEVLLPDGTRKTVKLKRAQSGIFTGSLKADVQGAYRVTTGDLSTIAAAGALNPTEFTHVIASADKLQPLSTASGGGIFWAGKSSDVPSLRKVKQGVKASGASFAGVVSNDQYTVTASRRSPFAPTWIYLLLILGALLVAWRLEGR